MEDHNHNEGKEQKPQDNTRRSFLKIGGAAIGIGALLGGAAIYSAHKVQQNKNLGGHASNATKSDTLTVRDHEGNLEEVDISKTRPLSASEIEEENLSLKEKQARGREGIPGKKWVMVIDLAKCENKRACIASCQSHHELKPEQYHINTLAMQDDENSAPYYMPKPCFHCDNPPCTKVCPVNATFKRQDGIVLIDNERCIGCRFCMAACPYSARIFNWSEPKYSEEQKNRVYDVELNVPQKKGTISKCLFSADQLRVGKLPYCVSSCPNGVYWFGDLNEDAVTNGLSKETVKFSKLIEENAGYTVLPELGTKPRVYYLPPKERKSPFPEDKKEELKKEQHS